MLTKSVYIALCIVLLISISCTTKLVEEITPTQNIAGTWKFQSANGSATVGGKTIDLTDDLSISANGATQHITRISTWVFREGGTGTMDGVNFTYIVSGKSLIISKNTEKYMQLSVTLKDGILEISEDENGLKTIIDEFNKLLTTDKITKYSRTLQYKSLQSILSTNGTPDCLLKTYTNINESTVNEYTHTYSDEHTLAELNVKTLRLSDSAVFNVKYTYLENKANLGSDVKPYVTILRNSQNYSKVYCDKNGRVNKREYYYSGQDNFPSEVDNETYDTNGNNIKTTKFFYDATNGEKFESRFTIYEAEYLNGNYIKLFYTDESTSRYLINEFTTWTFNAIKTKVVYPFNYGNLSFGANNKNHRTKLIYYDPSGTVSTQSAVVYTFDSKGYILSSEETFTGSSIKRRNIDYVYQCK